MTRLAQQFRVEAVDTATQLGSGTLEVLATPRMIAWMENTAMKLCASHTTEGDTTVGISINADHSKASKVGTLVTIEAEIERIDGRKISLTIRATDDNGNIIGTAHHDRFIVNCERFMTKLK